MVEVEVYWRLASRLPPTTSFWLKPYPRPPPQLSKSDYKVLTATAQLPLLYLCTYLEHFSTGPLTQSGTHFLIVHTHTHTLKQFGAMALVRGLRLSPWDRWRRRRSCSWSKVERGARTNWCPCAPKWLFSYFSCRSLSSSIRRFSCPFAHFSFSFFPSLSLLVHILSLSSLFRSLFLFYQVFDLR